MNHENGQYYTQFKSFCKTLTDNLNELEKQLKQFSKKADNNENCITIEGEIDKKLKEIEDLHHTLEDAYTDKNLPSGYPGPELDRRQKELQTFGQKIQSYKDSYKAIYDKKYGTQNIKFSDEDYSQKEEYKGMTTQELLKLEDKKIDQQNEKLEDILVDVKKGQVLAKNANHVLKEQNKKLEQVGTDMDRTDKKMNNVTKKLDRYIARQSTCKMIFILILELAIALGCYLVLW